MKNQWYYIKKYKELYDKCLKEAKENNSDDVTSLFWHHATIEHIVGYHMYWFRYSALEVWNENLERSIEMQLKEETDQDKEITMILERLCSF